MKPLVEMETWVCFATVVMLSAALVRPTPANEETGVTLGYNTLTFDLSDRYSYSSLMTSLRAQLTGTTACNLPATPSTMPVSTVFVLVDLKRSSEKIVTLAINVTDVYVVAYRDKLNGKYRANFLKDISKVARDNLFKDAGIFRDIPFSGTYKDLEDNAMQKRSNIELGILNLGIAIDNIYGKSPIREKLEAKFLLIAIQMVAEAARFKYIESKVSESWEHGSFYPDYKVLSLENNWAKISQGVHNSVTAKPSCVNINPEIVLENPDGSPWKVDKVATIRPEMGLLKFKDRTILGIEVSRFTLIASITTVFTIFAIRYISRYY